MKTTLMLLTLAAVAVSAPMPASAQDQDTLPSISVTPSNRVVVRYSDLDTNTDWGMRIFDTRLNRATSQVCRFFDGQLQEARVETSCRRAAKQDALAQFERNQMRRLDQAAARSPETASVAVTTH